MDINMKGPTSHALRMLLAVMLCGVMHGGLVVRADVPFISVSSNSDLIVSVFDRDLVLARRVGSLTTTDAVITQDQVTALVSSAVAAATSATSSQVSASFIYHDRYLRIFITKLGIVALSSLAEAFPKANYLWYTSYYNDYVIGVSWPNTQFQTRFPCVLL